MKLVGWGEASVVFRVLGVEVLIKNTQLYTKQLTRLLPPRSDLHFSLAGRDLEREVTKKRCGLESDLLFSGQTPEFQTSVGRRT
jgi:hypothetical protein